MYFDRRQWLWYISSRSSKDKNKILQSKSYEKRIRNRAGCCRWNCSHAPWTTWYYEWRECWHHCKYSSAYRNKIITLFVHFMVAIHKRCNATWKPCSSTTRQDLIYNKRWISPQSSAFVFILIPDYNKF